jgi:hypothetical protein
MNCVSCANAHNENFCPNCGEENGTKRISLASMLEDAFSFVTTMDRGFLFNLKALIIAPQKIVTAYISGQRKGIMNPISYLILTATVYLIIEGLLIETNDIDGRKNLPELYFGRVAYSAGLYIRIYFKYFWILSIIPLAISTQLLFRKYNFIEHLAIAAFMLGQSTLVGLAAYLLLRANMVINPLVYLVILWLTYSVFSSGKDKLETALTSFGVIVLFIVQLCLICASVGFIMA